MIMIINYHIIKREGIKMSELFEKEEAVVALIGAILNGKANKTMGTVFQTDAGEYPRGRAWTRNDVVDISDVRTTAGEARAFCEQRSHTFGEERDRRGPWTGFVGKSFWGRLKSVSEDGFMDAKPISKLGLCFNELKRVVWEMERAFNLNAMKKFEHAVGDIQTIGDFKDLFLTMDEREDKMAGVVLETMRVAAPQIGVISREAFYDLDIVKDISDGREALFRGIAYRTGRDFRSVCEKRMQAGGCLTVGELIERMCYMQADAAVFNPCKQCRQVCKLMQAIIQKQADVLRAKAG